VFRAVGPTSLTAAVKPIQYIASGTQVKHTDVGGTTLYSLPSVSPAATVTLGKALTSPVNGVLASGGTASYELALHNAGATVGTVDALTDTLPAGATLVPGSLRRDGAPLPEPRVADQVMSVEGPLRVPAAGATRLTYDLVHTGPAGVRTNAAVAHFGTVVLDASADVTAQDPAVAQVRVLEPGGPTLVDDAATAAGPGAPVQVAVLGNDSTTSGLPLAVTGVTTPARGAAAADTDGTVTYTPAAGWSGVDSFAYTATDGVSGSATATVRVTVPPGAVADVASTGTGSTLAGPSVLANDACGTCTVDTTLVSGPVATPAGSAGTVVMQSGGTYTYTPTGVTAGSTVRFTYRLRDTASGLTATAEVSINIGDLGADTATTPYGTAVSVDVLANDTGCRNSNCGPAAGTAPARGTATYPANNQPQLVTYRPTVGLWGLDAFAYKTTGTGNTTSPVTVLVGPPATTLTTSYGAPVTAALPSGGSCTGCTYALGSAPTQGAASVEATTGAVTWTPADGASGSDSFTYRVTSPATGLSVTGTVTVVIGPSAADDEATVLQGTAMSVQVGTNDRCPATCTRTLLSPPPGMTVDAQGWSPGRRPLRAPPPSATASPARRPARDGRGGAGRARLRSP
jgi:uncharacterized repeat protein (TIGR01451 family)